MQPDRAFLRAFLLTLPVYVQAVRARDEITGMWMSLRLLH